MSFSQRNTAIRQGFTAPLAVSGRNGSRRTRYDFSIMENTSLLERLKVENTSLLERLKARIEESAIKVSTVKAPHTYMKAVGTRELEKILEEEFKHGTK